MTAASLVRPAEVIQYAYLWSHEDREGHVEGRKDRPCAVMIVHSGKNIVGVCPITHTPPKSGQGVRVPAANLCPPGTRVPLNNYARTRRCLCGSLRLGLGECGLVIPNERSQTRRRPRRGPSRMGFAGEAASRSLRRSAVAKATVTRVAPTDLRPLRPKRAPRRVIQRFPRRSGPLLDHYH